MDSVLEKMEEEGMVVEKWVVKMVKEGLKVPNWVEVKTDSEVETVEVVAMAVVDSVRDV